MIILIFLFSFFFQCGVSVRDFSTCNGLVGTIACTADMRIVSSGLGKKFLIAIRYSARDFRQF